MALNYAAVIFSSIFEIYIASVFSGIFMNKNDFSKKNTFLIYFIPAVLYAVSSLIFNGFLLTVVFFAAVLSIMRNFLAGQHIKLLVAVSVSVISIAAELSVSGILALIMNNNFIHAQADSFIYILEMFLSNFLSFITVIFVRIVKERISAAENNLKNLLVSSVLLFTTLIIGFAIYKVLISTHSHFGNAKLIVFSMLMIFSNIVIYEIVSRQKDQSKAVYELALLKDNINEQTKHYADLRISHEEIRKMRHDLQNTYTAVIASLYDGNTCDAIEQLKHDLNIIELTGRVVCNGHPAIDTVVEKKLNSCRELNIKTNIAYLHQNKVKINEIEIALIIGNILDNAIEACRNFNGASKEIWGSIAFEKSEIIITIKNTAVCEKDLKTIKDENKNHGYGLKSISHIAKKYNGYAKFTLDSNIFTSFVILKN